MSVVLAFDTATPSTVVGICAVGGDGSLLGAARDDPAPGQRPAHAARLLELCEQALAQAGAGWADVRRIGAGTGPGTFTGLRIGIATARALAPALGAELAALSTLEALARAGREARPGASVVAAIDARRGEVFCAAWGPGGELLSTPGVHAPASLPALLTTANEPWLVVGDGATRYREQLAGATAELPPDGDELHRISASALCGLACEAAPAPAAELLPTYLRLPDAEIDRRRREQAGS